MAEPDWTPFIDATCQVFTSMAGVEIKAQAPRAKSHSHTYDISGNIGLTGQTHGAMTLCLGRDLACRITSSILGEEISEISEMVADSVGELANVIAGKVKKILGDLGNAAKITLPTVVTGPGHDMGYPPGIPCIVLPFSIPAWDTDFCLEVCVELKS